MQKTERLRRPAWLLPATRWHLVRHVKIEFDASQVEQTDKLLCCLDGCNKTMVSEERRSKGQIRRGCHTIQRVYIGRKSDPDPRPGQRNMKKRKEYGPNEQGPFGIFAIDFVGSLRSFDAKVSVFLGLYLCSCPRIKVRARL